MTRDVLYLLKPNLVESGRTYFCPECAMVEGILAYFPSVRYELDVQYVDFARPRPAMIELLGAENQGCPALILNRDYDRLPSSVQLRTAKERKFLAGPHDIASFLAMAYGTAHPH